MPETLHDLEWSNNRGQTRGRAYKVNKHNHKLNIMAEISDSGARSSWADWGAYSSRDPGATGVEYPVPTP